VLLHLHEVETSRRLNDLGDAGTTQRERSVRHGSRKRSTPNGARLALTSLRAKRATAVRELEAVLGRQLRERVTPDHARTQIISRLTLRHDDLTSHDPVLALVRRSMR